MKRFIQTGRQLMQIGPREPHRLGTSQPRDGVMRSIIIAATMAIGQTAVWAAVLPLTAQSAPTTSFVPRLSLSKALFLCRASHAIAPMNDRFCRPRPRLVAAR